MVRYKLVVAYNGRNFAGSQRQQSTEDFQTRLDVKDTKEKGKSVPRTVQGCLETALVRYTNSKVVDLCMRFAGRTDAGVHARGQIVAVTLRDTYDFLDLRRSLNSRLDGDLSIQDVAISKNPTLDPRQATVDKTYSYTLKYRRLVRKQGESLRICLLGPDTIRHALDDGSAMWVCPWSLDDQETLANLLDNLRGNHDFSAFCHKSDRHSGRDHTMNLKIKKTVVTETGEEAPAVVLRLEFTSKGFGRQMIRNLVGFIVDVCRGEIGEVDWDGVWQANGDMTKVIHCAPPLGLCLETVELESSI